MISVTYVHKVTQLAMSKITTFYRANTCAATNQDMNWAVFHRAPPITFQPYPPSFVEITALLASLVSCLSLASKLYYR